MSDLLKSMVRAEEAVDLLLINKRYLDLNKLPAVLEASNRLQTEVFCTAWNKQHVLPYLTEAEVNAVLFYARLGSLLDSVPVAGAATLLSQLDQHRYPYKQLLIRLHA